MSTYLQTLLDTIQQNVTSLQDELRQNGQPLDAHLQLHAPSPRDDPAYLPTHRELDLVERLQTDLRAVRDVLTPGPHKLLHLAMANITTQALHTAIELGVADAIRALGGTATSAALAARVGANETKLARLLGVLTVENVFRETSPGVFANNRHSLGLLREHGPGATSMLSLTAFENADAAFAFTPWASNPEAKDDFTPAKAPFTLRNNGVGFSEYVTQPEGQKTLGKLLNGVVPWLNKITRPPLLYDYPWASLGDATVVDLGCDAGDVGLDVLRLYPNIRWDFQDLGPVVERTRAALTPQLAELGIILLPPDSGSARATFTAHDYFQPQGPPPPRPRRPGPGQATKDEDDNIVFFMRGVPRDYGDSEALALFRATAESMRACAAAGTKTTSRPKLLINEIVCPSATVGSDEDLTKAHSQCVPFSTQSSFVETANAMAMSATTFLNGAERTYAQYQKLLEEAGLQVVTLHRLRTFTCIVECCVKDT